MASARQYYMPVSLSKRARGTLRVLPSALCRQRGYRNRTWMARAVAVSQRRIKKKATVVRFMKLLKDETSSIQAQLRIDPTNHLLRCYQSGLELFRKKYKGAVWNMAKVQYWICRRKLWTHFTIRRYWSSWERRKAQTAIDTVRDNTDSPPLKETRWKLVRAWWLEIS